MGDERLRAALLAACAIASAGCAALPPEPEPDPERWRWTVAPYLWAAGIDGDLKIDGEDLELEDDGTGGDSYFDPETALSGFMVHLEASRGPWTLALDPLFVAYDVEDSSSSILDAEISLRAQVSEGFIAREIVPSFEAFAGARYYGISTDVDIAFASAPPAELGDETSWVDPIVGLRWRTPIGERWSFSTRGDVGGFGVGSDFAWNADALFGYQFTRLFELQIGYRVLSVDFDIGSGSSRAEYNITMAGPVFLFAFTF